MSGDGDAAHIVNRGGDSDGGLALELRQDRADAEQMAVGSGDLDPRNDEEAIHGLAVGAFKPFSRRYL